MPALGFRSEVSDPATQRSDVTHPVDHSISPLHPKLDFRFSTLAGGSGATNLLPVTRKQIETAIDRFLGGISSESVLRELRSSIVKTRQARTNPRPLQHSPV